MSETLTQTATTEQTQTTDNNQQQQDQNTLASALWNETPVQTQTQQQQAASDNNQQAQQQAAATAEAEQEVLEEKEWLKNNFGIEDLNDFKTQWSEYQKIKGQPAPTAQEVKWVYDESKEDDIYNYINQKKQLERLEKYDIADVNQASEIIKANLQFKYKDLNSQQIDRLYQRQYQLPEKPVQNLESDEDYAQVLANWQRQVQEKEQDIMIDAKIAKPELINFKSQLVKPDTPTLTNANAQQQGPNQEDLAAQEALRNSFIQKLGTDYRNFKGYSVTAKDGDVELPISYGLNDDEKLAFNGTVQKAVSNINDFLDNDLGWWDKTNNSFNINKIQEDLYLLLNKEKVFSKLAGDASAQRYKHQLAIQNNIKLNGVNNQDLPIQPVPDEKAKQKQMADTLWGV